MVWELSKKKKPKKKLYTYFMPYFKINNGKVKCPKWKKKWSSRRANLFVILQRRIGLCKQDTKSKSQMREKKWYI